MARRRQHGEGSLHRRPDGRWQAVVELDRVGGKRRRRYFYGATQEEARGKAAKFVADRKAGFTRPTGKGPTVAEWLETWLVNICAAGPTTKLRYAREMRMHLVPALGHLRLAALTEAPIEASYASMTAQGLSPATVRLSHAVLCQALKVAVKRRLIPRNPCEDVQPPPLPRVTQAVPGTEEVTRLLATLSGRRNAARWLLALHLGLRQGEALGLTWGCVDLGAGRVRIDWQLQRAPFAHGCGGGCGRAARACPQRTGGRRLVPPKTATSEDVVPLRRRMVAELKAHRAAQAAERLAAGPAWQGWGHDCRRRLRPKEVVCPGCGKPADPAGLVFTDPVGRPLFHQADWVDWTAICEQAGLPHYRVHDLRHFTATFLLELGVDPVVVQAILRHASLAQTRGYQHVRATLMAEALDRAEARLWGRA